MSSINKVIIVGNLGKDPEVRSFSNGGRVVNFSVATSESWNDRASGERKERTEWHNIVVRNEKLGEIAEKYLTKGSRVYLEGSIQSRKYQDQSGQERYITEVVVGPFRGEIVLLGDRKGGEAASGEQRPRQSNGRDYGSAPSASPRAEMDNALGGDDIPF